MPSKNLRAIVVFAVASMTALTGYAQLPVKMDWQRLPDLPNSLGVAGPFVGVHKDVLIVAGGANFPLPVWETTKEWHSDIHVLRKTTSGYEWINGGRLDRPLGYGAVVSLPQGVLCMGGNNAAGTYRETFLLRWNAAAQLVEQISLPPLPEPSANGQAVVIDSVVYLAGGQSGSGLESAQSNFWSLDVNHLDQPEDLRWKQLPACPGGSRSVNMTLASKIGDDACIYVFSGRRQTNVGPDFLRDLWRFNVRTQQWQACSSAPHCRMAGSGLALPNGDLLILGGDDGSLFLKTDELKDQHPGFRRDALLYRCATNTWESGGTIPANHVTTPPCVWEESFIIATGEVRPRVRTPHVWKVSIGHSP